MTGNGSGIGDRDDAFEQVLRRAATKLDPVPTTAIAAARASFTWRTVDAELALLTYDSATEDAAAVGVRGDGARLLAFEADGITLDVEVRWAGAAYDVVG